MKTSVTSACPGLMNVALTRYVGPEASPSTMPPPRGRLRSAQVSTDRMSAMGNATGAGRPRHPPLLQGLLLTGPGIPPHRVRHRAYRAQIDRSQYQGNTKETWSKWDALKWERHYETSETDKGPQEKRSAVVRMEYQGLWLWSSGWGNAMDAVAETPWGPPCAAEEPWLWMLRRMSPLSFGSGLLPCARQTQQMTTNYRGQMMKFRCEMGAPAHVTNS